MRWGRPLLVYKLACGVLPREKECLNQLTFTTHDHPWEALVPITFRNFGLTVKPASEQRKLVGGYLAALNAVKQVLKESGWDRVPAYPGHQSP